MDQDEPRQHHDIGGVPSVTCRAVNTEPHVPSGLHRAVDAPFQCLGAERLRPVGDARRGTEAIPEGDGHLAGVTVPDAETRSAA